MAGFAIVAFLGIAVCAANSCAAEDQVMQNGTPQYYRQVFVPADDPAAWPRGDEKYVPIDASDFNAWIAAANKRSKPDDADAMDVAEYTGRLDENGRLAGRGRWDVVKRFAEPTFLKFSQPSIVITNLRWKDAEKQPVRFGAWGKRGGVPTDWGLLVSRSGSIEFDWCVQGRAQGNGLEIPWRVPNATTNRVTLELSKGQQPTITGGVVSEKESVASPESDAAPMVRWKFAIPATSDAMLQIVSPGANKSDSSEQPSLRETVTYQLGRRGLNVSAIWSVGFRDSKQHDLAVLLPSGLELTSVTVDGRAADWRVENGESSAGANAKISVPSAGEASEHRVELAAWQPLSLDRTWKLPILHPDSIFWSAGQFQLDVSPDLELRNVSASDCIQQAARTTTRDGSAGQSLSFAAYSPSAALEVRVSSHEPEAAVRMCSSLALADPDVTGKLATEWNVSQGSLYSFSGELSPGWNIEAVETIPSDALAEWFIDRSGRRQILKVQLTHPAAPGHSVALIVNGRLQRSSLTEPIMADALRIVRWSNSRVQQHLVAFQSTEPFVAETIGNLPVVPRDQIGESERELLDINTNENQVVDVTRAGSDAGLRLNVRRAEYKAELELDADYGNNELRQDWRISARPTANAIDRLLVYATSSLGDNVRWVERSTNNPVVAELIAPDDPRRKELPKDGEVWLLRLSQPTSKLVELGVSTASPLAKRRSLPLLSLPQAIEQHAAVNLHGPAGNAFSIESTGLSPIPISAADARPSAGENDQAVRAAFRYSPTECLENNRVPTFSIAPPAGSGTAAFIIRRVRVDSFIWPNGKVQHCATYDLMSDGVTDFRPQLPSGSELNAIIFNHQLLDVAKAQSGASTVPVSITLGSRLSNIKIYFQTHQPPLGSVSMLSAPLALNDPTILAREWNVWLPEGFEAKSESDRSLNWRQRMFGPIARGEISSPTDPLQSKIATPSASFSETSRAKPSEDLPRIADSASDPPTAKRVSASQVDVTRGTPSSAALPEVISESDATAGRMGWHVVHQADLADGGLSPLTVTRTAAISSWEVVALLVGFLIASLCGIRGRRLFVACAIAASLAILLPSAIAPLATGALWGLVFSAIKEVREAWVPSKRSAFTDVIRAAAAGGVIILLAATPQSAIAEPASAVDAPVEAKAIERVLIPIDADKKPVGSKYFVGERFLHRLLGSQSGPHASEHTWLLRDALYVGELTDSHDAAEVSAGRWSLAFSIETLARNTTVSLPLVKNEADWETTAMLDGVPIPIAWRNDGRDCTLEVSQPGVYTLTLFCTPKTTSAGDRRKLALSIPELASAKVQVHLPAQLAGVTIADANVAAPAKDSSRTISGELVQAARLVVDWPRLKEKSSVSQGLSIAELKWLRVGPTGVELETKYVLEGGSRRPESLLVRYDPHWTPTTRLPEASSDKDEETVGGLKTLSIPLDGNDNDRQEVVIRWKLEGAPALGLVRLPPIYLSSPSVTQRWLALSVGASLDCTLSDNNTSAATSNEFMNRWGTDVDAPSITTVAANFTADRGWVLAVRPRDVDPSVREVLHVAVGLQRLRVIYEANVVPGNAERFGLRLVVPEKLNIDSINLMEADRQIPARWVRDGADHVNVFFTAATRGDYRFTLSGTLPTTTNEAVHIPRVSAVASSATQVQLYRDDDVEVKLKGFPSAADSKATGAELPPIQWLVRPLGNFRLNDEEFQKAELTVSAAQPALTGDMVTSVSHESGGWWATVNMHFTPSSNLDAIRLQFPPACSGPFEVDSSVPESKEIVASSEGGQNLVIRFTSTVTPKNAVDLRIRSPLTTLSGAAVEVPRISTTPLVGQSYISVPATLDSGPLSWSEVGVQPAKVPEHLLQGTPGKQLQYAIISTPFALSAHLQTPKQTAPRVRLADTSVGIGENGAQSVLSSFVISPGGVANCEVELPPGQRLLLAELDGRDALIVSEHDSRWRVTLNSTQLPQVLEILSHVERVQSSDRVRELARPTLLVGGKKLPVEVSLWSISQRAGSPPIAIVGASPVSSIDQAALRFDRLVSIAESASAAAAEAPQPDGANWFRPWAARLEAVHQQSTQLAGFTATRGALARLPRASEEQVSHIAARYEKWLEESIDLFGNVGGSIASLSSELSVEEHAGPDQQTTHYVSDGDAAKLAVRANEPAAMSARLKSVAAIVVILAAGLWLTKMPAVSDVLYRYPYVVGVLVGIGCWAWLKPGWLGVVIAAASAIFALRFNWPGRYLRPEASTVLRSTRTS